MSGQDDYRRPVFGRRQGANAFGRLHTAKDRHLHVHQHDIDGADTARADVEPASGELAVDRDTPSPSCPDHILWDRRSRWS